MENCVCTLIRQDAKHPWGFSLQGGRDYGRSLTIQKINPRSIAEQRGLRLGDTILQIGRERTVDMSHQNAQDAIIRSGNRLDLIVLRPIPQTDKRIIQQEKQQEKIRTVIHKQHYNSPLPLYSTQNIADTLATQTKALTNGTFSVNQRTMSAPTTTVKRTEVYRTVHTEEEDEEEEEEEEEEEGKWGVITGHQSQNLLSRNVVKSPILQSQSFLRLQRSLEESETSSSAASSPSASPTYMKRQVAAPQPPPKPVPARNEVQSPQYDQYQKQQQQQYYYQQQQQQIRQQQVVQQQQPPRQSPQQQVLLQQQQQQRQPPPQQQQQQRQVPQQQPQQQQRQPPQQQQRPVPQQQPQQQRQPPPQQQPQQQRQPPQQQQRPVPQQQPQQQRQPPQQQQPQQRQPTQQQQRPVPQQQPQQRQQQPVARPQTQQHQQQAKAPSSVDYNNVSAPRTGSTFTSIIPTENYPTQGGGSVQPTVTWSPSMGRKPVWPPQKSQDALSTSSQSVKWRGGTPSKKFIWPPPKDYVEVDEEYSNGHVHTVYKEAPSHTSRTSRVYVSPRAPARLAAQAWEPYSGQAEEDAPQLGSGPGRRLRRFNDIFIPNSTRLPPTYRAPPGTQHVEFAYE